MPAANPAHEALSPDGAAPVRVSSMQVRAMIEALDQVGVPAASFIARTGLDVALLSDSYGWFTLEVFDSLLLAACEVTNDPAFGLHWGERSPMMQFDLVPTLVATAPTLRVALDCVLQLQPLFASRAEFRLSEQRDRCELTCDVLAVSEAGIRIRSELVCAGISRLPRYLGEADSIRRINLAYARPAHGAEYDRLFGSLVHFDQPRTSIEFTRSALDRPHPERNAELHQTLRTRTEQQRQRVLQQQSYAEQLEEQIRAALPNLLSMADAARSLELSERSLRRRLMQEGLTYKELVDQVQHRLADELLSVGTKSVKEIAHALGFSSPSGFHRAFRRWTGSSPARERTPRARS